MTDVKAFNEVRLPALDYLHNAMKAEPAPISEDLILTTYDGNEPLYDYDIKAKRRFLSSNDGLSRMQRKYDQSLWSLGCDILRATNDTCCIEVYDDIMAKTGEHEWWRLEELAPDVKPEQVTRLWYIDWSHKRADGKVWQSNGQWDNDAGSVFHSKLDAFIWLYSKASSGQIWDDKYKLGQ